MSGPEFDPNKSIYGQSIGAYHGLVSQFLERESNKEGQGKIEDTELYTLYQVAEQSPDLAVKHYFTQLIRGGRLETRYESMSKATSSSPFMDHAEALCLQFPPAGTAIKSTAEYFCDAAPVSRPVEWNLASADLHAYQASVAEWEINQPTMAPERALALIHTYIAVPTLVETLIAKAFANQTWTPRQTFDFVHKSIGIIEQHTAYGYNDHSTDLISSKQAQRYHRLVRSHALPLLKEWAPALDPQFRVLQQAYMHPDRNFRESISAYVRLLLNFSIQNSFGNYETIETLGYIGGGEKSGPIYLTKAEHAFLFEIAYASDDAAIQSLYASMMNGGNFVTRYAEEGPTRTTNGHMNGAAGDQRNFCLNFGMSAAMLYCDGEEFQYDQEEKTFSLHVQPDDLSAGSDPVEAFDLLKVSRRPVHWIGLNANEHMRQYANAARALPYRAIGKDDAMPMRPQDALAALEQHNGVVSVVAGALESIAKYHFDNMTRGEGVNRQFHPEKVNAFFDDLTTALNILATSTDIDEDTKRFYGVIAHDLVRGKIVAPPADMTLGYRREFDKQLFFYREAIKGKGTLFSDAMWNGILSGAGAGAGIGLVTGLVLFWRTSSRPSIAYRVTNRIMPRLAEATTRFHGRHPFVGGVLEFVLPMTIGAFVGAAFESSESHVEELHAQAGVQYEERKSADGISMLPIPYVRFMPPLGSRFNEGESANACKPFGQLDCDD